MKRYGVVETVLSRHETWKKGYMRSQILNMILSVGILCALIMTWGAVSRDPETKYFVAREDGGILPIVPEDQPYLTDSQINNFAVEAVTRAFTISFANWRSDLDEASAYFIRPAGWNGFLQSLTDNGTLNDIQANRLVSSAVANGASITASGINPDGRFGWLVQVPVTVTYQSSTETKRDNWLAEMEILRVSPAEMSRGVGVMRINMRRGQQ